jgi:hypothetical protein
MPRGPKGAKRPAVMIAKSPKLAPIYDPAYLHVAIENLPAFGMGVFRAAAREGMALLKRGADGSANYQSLGDRNGTGRLGLASRLTSGRIRRRSDERA